MHRKQAFLRLDNDEQPEIFVIHYRYFINQILLDRHNAY
jgi:hypothetical protein